MLYTLTTSLLLITSTASALPASPNTKLGLSADTKIFGSYITDWAHYRKDPYTWSPSDYSGIANRTDLALYSFVYFCPPADTNPMPYWAVAPFGNCTKETEFELMPIDPIDDTGIPQIVAMGRTTQISVGGWNFPSSYFSKMVATAESRTKFVNSVKSWMAKYGIKGVDLDWEFPCSPARSDPVKITCEQFHTVEDAGGDCPADSNNLVELAKDLRKGLGDNAYISIASQASKTHAAQMSLKEVTPFIDMWNLMSYDYAVSDITTQSTTSPNAPLYNPADGVQMSINQTVSYYLSAGVPRSKMMIGLPLYAHTFFVPGLSGSAWQKFGLQAKIQGECCGPFKATYGAKPGVGCQLCGSMMYSEILAAQPKTFYDKQTESVIGYFEAAGSDNYTEAGTWLTYNDVQSAQAVVAYAEKQGVAGVFVYSADMDTKKYELMNAIADALGKPKPSPTPPSGGNECHPSKSCNVCDKCCSKYIPDGATCDQCVKEQCPKKNECSPSKSCNVCDKCCNKYIPDGAACDQCVKEQCPSPGPPGPPSPGPPGPPGPAGKTPTCEKAGQAALCKVACASQCRGFQPGFGSPGCVDETDCTNPPAWAKNSVCTC